MTYIMSCVWLDYMVKYFQCKNCVGSSPKTKKCVASFLVPGDIKSRTRTACPAFSALGDGESFGILHKRHLLSLSRYATIVTTN